MSGQHFMDADEYRYGNNTNDKNQQDSSSQNQSNTENPKQENAVASGRMGGGGGGGGGHGGGSWGGGHGGGGWGGGGWGGGHGGGSWGGGGWSGQGGGYGPQYYPPQGGYAPSEPRVNRYTYTIEVEQPEQPSEPGEEEPGIEGGNGPGDDGNGDGPGDDGIDEGPGDDGNGEEPPPDDGEEPPPDDGIDIATLIDIINTLLNGLGIDTNSLNINVDNGSLNFGGGSNWGSFYGDPSATSVPMSQDVINQHVVTKDNPKNIKGCYKTTFGIMRLHIKDNNTVTGSYHYHNRVQYLKGKLKDNILVGVWMEDVEGKKADKVGTFQFAFKPKWASFTGFWGNKGEKKLTNKWDGKKIKCPLPPMKDKNNSKETKSQSKSGQS